MPAINELHRLAHGAVKSAAVFELVDFTHATSAPQPSARLPQTSKQLHAVEGAPKEKELTKRGSRRKEWKICRDGGWVGGWGGAQEVNTHTWTVSETHTHTYTHTHTGAYMTSHYPASPAEDRGVGGRKVGRHGGEKRGNKGKVVVIVSRALQVHRWDFTGMQFCR